MRRLRDYYRQFEALTPEEASRELRERREGERARTPATVPLLDLARAAWAAPPHPEAVNAATFALRGAVNAYPDPAATPLREALAAAHGVNPEQVVVGHGAGELLRGALRALAGRGEVLVGWPGWRPLPALVREAGGTPVPVRPEALHAALRPDVRAVVLDRPADPTGAAPPLEELRALAAALPEAAWLVLDEALAGFLPAGEDGPLEHPRVLRVRSFSKDHALAGLRVGYALLPAPGGGPLAAALTPVLGASAPGQAAALWAVQDGRASAFRRRATAARERARLSAALAGTSCALAPGHGPYAWLSSDRHDGRALAAGLAARRILVASGGAWGDERHVRVTVRDGAATDRLADALRDLDGVGSRR
jgi:histidinol-phosphate aminotransferase